MSIATIKNLNKLLGCLFILTISPMSFGETADQPEAVQEFIQHMVKEHRFDANILTETLAKAEKIDKILDAMDTQAEKKAWHIYKKIFLDKQRLKGGVEFWNQNSRWLLQAQTKYGVPAEIIVAIIGVETRYGKRQGGFRVLDALYTLAFFYPQRAEFFRKELAQFLVLSRDEKLDPLEITGSFAGAIGMPQFMPSSFQQYAVDFDQNNTRDLIGSTADTIGSVANFLAQHGWKKGQIIYTPAKTKGHKYKQAIEMGIKPQKTVLELKKYGISPQHKRVNNLPATVFELQFPKKSKVYLGFNNFYVITRYNRSVHYAMAVIELSQSIVKHRQSKRLKIKPAPEYSD